jgi:exocyst complex component 6
MTDKDEARGSKRRGANAAAVTSTTTTLSGSNAPVMTVRARRRREEAVRRLVADVQSKAGLDDDIAAMAETHDWLVASTVATALEKGLDRDLHAELVQEAKDNAGRIGQVCHDHADVFLASVAQVAALAAPSADLADGLKDAQSELQLHTAGPMHEAATQWEEARQSYARARTVTVMVGACQSVAIQLERARKQAALGRPRAALDAVDRARSALTTPVESLFVGPDEQLWKETIASEQKTDESLTATAASAKKLSNLEQTPFGKRAILFLPKIENEVLMSARRGLNRWFLSLRNGDAAKAGRSAIRETAHAAAAGPGALGLGGTLPASFLWRAQMAENWMARTGQNSKVARACRLGYWFDRDAPKDAEKLQTALPSTTAEGSERYAESIAVALGWYRCWEDGSSLLVDPSEYAMDGMDGSTRGSSTSRHGGSLSGSRHGLSGSRHGLRASRHGSAVKKSLGFRASTSSRSQAYQDITSTLGAAGANKVTNQASLWTELLVPSILLSNSATRYVVLF